MKTTLILLALSGCLATVAKAQMPPTCVLIDAGFLANSWGGVTETPDGGAAFTGGYDFTNAGNSDVVVTKLGADGALQWMKSYSTGTIPAEFSRGILATTDGGLAVTGYLEAGQVFIMKLDADGGQQWTKTYEAPGGAGHQMANAFTQLPDGGFALVETSQFLSYDNWFMLRTDANGEVLWSDELDYFCGYPMDVAVLPNGDLVFVGGSANFYSINLVMRKDGLTGATEWKHWYTPGTGISMLMSSVVVAPDSTIVVSGLVGVGTSIDAYALALMPDGQPLWATHIGTDQNEYADNIALAPNGDYLLAGMRLYNGFPASGLGQFVVRLDPDGQLLWSRNLTNPDANYSSSPVRCTAASDGGVLVTGYTSTPSNYPQGFTKLDAAGNSCAYCPSEEMGNQDSLAITMAPDMGFGNPGPWATAADLTFTVADLTPVVSATICGSTGLQVAPAMPSSTLAPNPFTEFAVLTLADAAFTNGLLEIRDVTGRLAHAQPVSGSSARVERGTLAAGHYAYRLLRNGTTVACGTIQVTD